MMDKESTLTFLNREVVVTILFDEKYTSKLGIVEKVLEDRIELKLDNGSYWIAHYPFIKRIIVTKAEFERMKQQSKLKKENKNGT
jgi:hypothetical protein